MAKLLQELVVHLLAKGIYDGAASVLPEAVALAQRPPDSQLLVLILIVLSTTLALVVGLVIGFYSGYRWAAPSTRRGARR